MAAHDNSLGTIVIFKDTLHVVTLAIRTPIGLLRIVRFKSVLSLHLQGDNQVGTWIRIRLTSLSKFYVTRHDESFLRSKVQLQILLRYTYVEGN